jgi:antitoxin MazE
VITAEGDKNPAMKTSLVRIGNSRGIRIPKAILEQCHLTDVVELDVQNGTLVVRSTTEPRSGWEDAFCDMHKQGDDGLLDKKSLPPTEWDKSEWEW